MSSTATLLGLSSQNGLSMVPCYGPYYLMFQFLFAYGVVAPRHLKQILGIDNNVNPRDNSATLGEEAVKAGKITRAQLNMVKRNEAAQANTVENYTLFVAGVLSAQVAGVPHETINRMCAVYVGARVGYALAYIFIDRFSWSLLRSTFWWIGNVSCIHLLWKAGKILTA